MATIERKIEQGIKERLKPNKAVLLFGARRVGKTFLLKKIVGEWDEGNAMLLNGEDGDTLALLEERTASNYRRLLNGISLLVIDEAQNVPDIGAKLKLIVDEIPDIKVLASGSSSFDLLNRTGEPLVGRATQLTLTPFAQNEIGTIENALETRQQLETRLIYGSYPEVVLMDNDQDRAEYLHNIVNAYLLKDLLSIDGIRNANKMRDMLRLLAFQQGSEVSFDELGKQLGLSKNTVEKYLDLLTKVFVVYRLTGFSRNLRKEVRKSNKWYFYDTGVRNAVINKFQPLSLRDNSEIGHLWENYLINERVKLHLNNIDNTSLYMWRTYDQQEIDLIEETNDELRAYEFKWGDQTPAAPIAFSKAYPNAPFNVVNRNNYLDFIDQ